MLECGLSCKRSGLIGIHHDDVRHKWAHLCSIALTNLQAVIKLTIFYGKGLQAGTSNAPPTTLRPANPANNIGDEARGDVIDHGFWNHGQGTVFDVCICDTDSTRLHASDDAETSPLLSTLSTAWLPRTRKWLSNALPCCLQRSGAEHTRTWPALSAQG
ncbi:hypothetical protein ACHAW6_002996 [Cyclotella cf. meneghiniana]